MFASAFCALFTYSYVIYIPDPFILMWFLPPIPLSSRDVFYMIHLISGFLHD